MIGFLKFVGFGLIFMITSPLFVLAWALAIIYCLMAFIFLSFKSIFVFFSGRTLFSPLKEDLQAKKAIDFARLNHDPVHKSSSTEGN